MLKNRMFYGVKLILAMMLAIPILWTGNATRATADGTGVNTNLSGWATSGDAGTLTNSADGKLLTSGGNFFALSTTTANDFTYETDVTIRQFQGSGALVFRSNNSGWGSYMLQIDPVGGRIRLKDANGDRELGVYSVSLAANTTYHLKVRAVGSALQVYWGSSATPVISINDNAYTGGYLGVQVWNSSMLFQNIIMTPDSITPTATPTATATPTTPPVYTNLSGWGTSNLKSCMSRGEWTLNQNIVKGVGSANAEATCIADSVTSDFVFEGDVTVDSQAPQAVAGLMFRSDRDGTNGYILRIRPSDHTVTLLKKHGDTETVIQSKSGIPLKTGNKHHIEITAIGSNLTVYVDGYSAEKIVAQDADFLSGYAGMTVKNGAAYFQDVYLTPYSNYYTELYRPQYHFTDTRGWASDPNGLVYFEGEYHLFHQDGGQWAHAISTDLLHWKQMPLALKWNHLGHIWSGSTVADLTNASGLFGDSGGKGLIAYYTSFNPNKPNGNQKIGAAYSKDKGRTWVYYGDDAIVPNPGGINGSWDFRDPKVVRDDVNNRWIMVVSGGDHIRFFTSTDLLHWTWTDNFGYSQYIRGGVWECPDLFQLAVDGNANNKKWVLMISTGGNPNTQGSSAEYFIGQVTADGKFVNDNLPGKVLLTDFGKENYAGMSFYNTPDNRRITMGWMSNWDYPFSFPTEGWKGQLTIPRELSLKTVNGNVILAQNPISELSSLRGTDFSVNNVSVTPQSGNILGKVNGNAYEIVVELQLPNSGAATEFGFRLREGGGQKTVVGYRSTDNKMFIDRSASGRTDFASNFTTLHEAVVQPVNGVVRMHILVDESSLELFGNDGAVVFSDIILPDSTSSGMSFYASGGTVVVKSLHVYSLKNTWRSSM
ncbi:GH32 C-terminal domain-containing protein [Paenibacillus sp. FSL R10-2771]|uniref:GH32 C-terminal domain-containing protein n=1 Tax=Paenibacillus sp. FSL R10-2771 TaxID=2954693 RepID=UPI0030F97F0F